MAKKRKLQEAEENQPASKKKPNPLKLAMDDGFNAESDTNSETETKDEGAESEEEAADKEVDAKENTPTSEAMTGGFMSIKPFDLSTLGCFINESWIGTVCSAFNLHPSLFALVECSQADPEEKKSPVRDASSPITEIESEKEQENTEDPSIQQITLDTEAEEGLQVATDIQAREEEVEQEAEEITEEERVTLQLKETDETAQTIEEEEEEEEEEEGEEETQCSSQKNNLDHQYFSGDFGKVQTKVTEETERDSEDDEGDEEEEEQTQVAPSDSLIAPVTTLAQELEPHVRTTLAEDEEEEEEDEEEERDDASDKDSPTVVIELGSDGDEEEEEEEEDDGEEEEPDEADDEDLDSMSLRSEVTDDSETYDMTRGNLGLLEQAIALKAEQIGRSSEESCSPGQQLYHSPEGSLGKGMDITARRGYYGKGDKKCLTCNEFWDFL